MRGTRKRGRHAPISDGQLANANTFVNYPHPYGWPSHNINNYSVQSTSLVDDASLARYMQGTYPQNNSLTAPIMTQPASYSTVGPNGHRFASTAGSWQAYGVSPHQIPQYTQQIHWQPCYFNNDLEYQPLLSNTVADANAAALIAAQHLSILPAAYPLNATHVNFAGLGVPVGGWLGSSTVHNFQPPIPLVGQHDARLAAQEHIEVSPRLRALITQDPPIPEAIQTSRTRLRPLHEALKNPNGVTIVYIRGLLPNTTRRMLEQWVTRFGDIERSMPIIDRTTGLCREYGFVQYRNFKDAENCIRALHSLCYEVNFARGPIGMKPKTFSEGNNLYISNLPKTMEEHHLIELFVPHKVSSARILRDENGHGRGAGFACFETHEVCEEVIRTFNNRILGEDNHIRVQYSDTQQQRALKRQTHAARQV